VQQAIQSSREFSTMPVKIETTGTVDEPTQLRQIVEKVEARLRRSQEDTVQATQDLEKVQITLRVQQRKEE
jgi:hypothetical protein